MGTDSVGAVLDSGSTLSYLYSEQIEAVGEALHGRYSSSAGAYIVDCRFLNTNSTLDIQFGGKTIKVPVSDLVLHQVDQLVIWVFLNNHRVLRTFYLVIMY